MRPIRKRAQLARLLYLIVVVSGLFSLMFVPAGLFVRGDAGATAVRILANETP